MIDNIKCWKCDGLGLESWEDGRAGATWIAYRMCHICKGSKFERRMFSPDRDYVCNADKCFVPKRLFVNRLKN